MKHEDIIKKMSLEEKLEHLKQEVAPLFGQETAVP